MPDTSDKTDVELVCQLRDGSEKAFAILFHRYQEKVYQFCMRFTHCSSIAEEWLQDAFVQVWLHKEHLDPDKSFSGYLHVIARNKALDHIKQEATAAAKKSEWIKNAPTTDSRTQEFMEAVELNRITHKAIKLLPSQRRKIYLLSRDEGLSHRDISIQMKLSQGTVKHQIVLSLRFLRQYLLDHYS